MKLLIIKHEIIKINVKHGKTSKYENNMKEI